MEVKDSIRRAAEILHAGGILAVKGVGGYHLACDARNPDAVADLRHRKYRKEKPFALMVRDIETARTLVELSADAETLLTSVARPIVLAPARIAIARGRAGEQRTGCDVALRAFAPFAIRCRRAGSPGDDQRESIK